MPKKLTIIGVLAALVLGIVGFAQQGAEAYTAQSYCTNTPGGVCPAGASPVDVVLCYGGAAPTVLGSCGAGSSPNTIPAAAEGLPITNYTQIIIPAGSRLTLPITYTPPAWGTTSPARCVNDETSFTCTGANQTGDVSAQTDLLCDGTTDILSSTPVAVATWPGGATTPYPFYRTWDTVSGPPPAGDPNAYLELINTMPKSFPFKSIDKARLTDLFLGGTGLDLNLPTLTGSATPLQLLSHTSSYNGATLSAALLAGSPAPPSTAYLCLQSPQNSVSSNNTLVVPATDGYYPRWVDIQSDADRIDGSVTRVLVMNCVIVGTPASPDSDGDCLSNADEVTAGTNPAVADTDGDGLPDGLEVANGSKPLVADFDADGCTDFCELFQFTDPNNADTDGDGHKDLQNTLAGFNSVAPYYNQTTATDNCPTIANDAAVVSVPPSAPGDFQNNTDSKPDHTLTPASGFTDVTNPHQDHTGDACDTDSDNDGIVNVAEGGLLMAGSTPGVGKSWCKNYEGTSPVVVGGVTYTLTTLDPLNPDSDGDGGLDGVECEMTSNPQNALSRFPNAASGEDPDLDGLFAPGAGAGANAAAENFYYTGSINIGGQACPVAAVGACSVSASGNLLNDIDNDGKIGTADADSDNDGLTDGAEVKFYGTSPANADTDGDGCPDGKEAGDINGDRKVTATDLQQVAARFGNIRNAGTGQVDPLKTNYDFNKDGNIAAADLQGVAKVFGNCLPQTGLSPISPVTVSH